MTNNSTPTTVAATTAVDPFDPAAFAVSPQALAALQGDICVVPQLTGISVWKPDKQAFFRVSPDPAFAITVPLLELKQERETYLVLPAIAMHLPGDCAMKELRLCQTRQGVLFLWPLAVIDEGEKRQRNEWHTSARQVAATATRQWVRMSADMSAGRYNMAIATGLTGDPVWPETTMRDLLELAFGKERTITEMGHPLVKRLLGVE